jgi:phosphomannomutase
VAVGWARPSSLALQQAVVAGVEALGGVCTDLGEVTTPQLHFVTHATNSDPTHAHEAAYFAQLASAFRAVLGPGRTVPAPVIVDAAHGVAAPKLVRLGALLADTLAIVVVNDGSAGGELNHKARVRPYRRTQPHA